MTTLIYRGIPHAPESTAAPRQPKPMMYRGVSHAGLAPRAIRFAALMTYRGVDYVLSSTGERRPVETAAGQGALA